MKKLVSIICTLCACAFVLHGCVDREFDLADVSGEVTIGGEELVVPLADINKVSLSSLLAEMEGITQNEEGVYQISFSSFGEDPTKYEQVSIEGFSIPNITGLSPELDPISFSFGSLPTSLLLTAVDEVLDVELPTQVGNVVDIEPIAITQPIDFKLPSQLSGQGYLTPQILSLLNAMNLSTVATSGGDEMVFDAELTILPQLEKVDWVEFGCEDHPYGAPFNLKFETKGLGGVVGDGSVKINVTFPDGYYLRDENGVDFPVATHNVFSKEIALAPKQSEINMVVYLHKIDYSDHEFVGGKLKIDDHIKYSYDIAVKFAEGNYNLNSKPQLTVSAAPEYKDVEVKINHFEIPNVEHPLSYTFNGIPSGVDIEKIGFKQGSNLTIYLKGLEWCVIKDNLTGDDISPKIEIDLPLCLRFNSHPLLNNDTNVLLASTVELAQGVTLSLDHIDCKNSSGIKLENGALEINEKIVAGIHMESLDGHTVLVSSITPPANTEVRVGIKEARLEVDTAPEKTKVVWVDDQVFDFDLEDNIPTLAQTIEIPEIIAAVKSVEIGKAGTSEPLSMKFNIDAGNAFPVSELDVNVSVNLGKMLRPTKKMLDEGTIIKNSNGDYLITINESWNPMESSLTKVLEFEALENLPDIVDGKIAINQTFPVSGSVKIKSGENIDLSKLDNAKVNIDLKIDDIEVRNFTGKVDISVKPESVVAELGFGELGGIDITSLNINPVITLRLKDNPTGVGLNADVKIKTYDSSDNVLTTITIPTISIAGEGGTTIVLSTPRNASKYDVEGVTFVAIDNLSQLLKGLPSKVGVDMEVFSNKEEEITIDVKEAAKGYNIEYQYEVLLPFEFDGDVELGYQTSLGGLNKTFATLADQTKSLKVGDVGLIAEFATTIPFNVVLSAELINAEGTTEGIAARLNINDCVIKGYNKEKDGEKSVSKIDLDFDLGESGSLEGLRAADGVRIKLAIYDTGAESAVISGDQYLEGKLKLRLRDGVSVDIFELLNGANMNE